MKKIGHLHSNSLNGIARGIDPAATAADIRQLYHVYHVCAHIRYSFYARQRSYSAYMPWQFRLSVCLSVCHTGGSVKNG